MYRRHTERINEQDVPESQHTIFIRGLPGSVKTSDIREFFEDSFGSCTFDFIKLSQDREKLHIAVRFVSKTAARECMEKYRDGELFGYPVQLSWFRDIRRYLNHLSKQQGGAPPGRFRGRFDNRRRFGGGGRRNWDRSRSRSRSASKSPPSRRSQSPSRSRSRSGSHSALSPARSGDEQDISQVSVGQSQPDQYDKDFYSDSFKKQDAESPSPEPTRKSKKYKKERRKRRRHSVSHSRSRSPRSRRHVDETFDDEEEPTDACDSPRHHHRNDTGDGRRSGAYKNGDNDAKADEGSDMDTSDVEQQQQNQQASGGGSRFSASAHGHQYAHAPPAQQQQQSRFFDSPMNNGNSNNGGDQPPIVQQQQQQQLQTHSAPKKMHIADLRASTAASLLQNTSFTVDLESNSLPRQNIRKEHYSQNDENTDNSTCRGVFLPVKETDNTSKKVVNAKTEIMEQMMENEKLAQMQHYQQQQKQLQQQELQQQQHVYLAPPIPSRSSHKQHRQVNSADVGGGGAVDATTLKNTSASVNDELSIGGKRLTSASTCNLTTSPNQLSDQQSTPVFNGAMTNFKTIQRLILQDVRYKPSETPEKEKVGNFRLSSLSTQKSMEEIRNEKMSRLSNELKDKVERKKLQLELSYRHDCETFGLMTRKLISKDRSLEDRLRLALLEIMKDLETEAMRNLDEYLDQMIFLTV